MWQELVQAAGAGKRPVRVFRVGKLEITPSAEKSRCSDVAMVFRTGQTPKDHFGSTDAETGTVQRRLARPLHTYDTQIQEASPFLKEKSLLWSYLIYKWRSSLLCLLGVF